MKAACGPRFMDDLLIHAAQAPAAACACIIISVRTRRRMISLRMAARCSVKNKSVKATIMIRSGVRMAG